MLISLIIVHISNEYLNQVVHLKYIQLVVSYTSVKLGGNVDFMNAETI